MNIESSSIRVYKIEESIVFQKNNEPFGELSNMATCFPLTVNSISIKTSEALYQTCRFPHLPDVQRLIIEQKSPMAAKMKSCLYKVETRKDWQTVRVSVMRWCLRVKLAQHWNVFGAVLLSTNDYPIVEKSKRDSFWGAKPTDDGTLVGFNVLGRLLMELRELLKANNAENLQVVVPPNIDNFLLDERSVGEIVCKHNITEISSVSGKDSDDPKQLTLLL